MRYVKRALFVVLAIYLPGLGDFPAAGAVPSQTSSPNEVSAQTESERAKLVGTYKLIGRETKDANGTWRKDATGGASSGAGDRAKSRNHREGSSDPHGAPSRSVRAAGRELLRQLWGDEASSATADHGDRQQPPRCPAFPGPKQARERSTAPVRPLGRARYTCQAWRAAWTPT